MLTVLILLQETAIRQDAMLRNKTANYDELKTKHQFVRFEIIVFAAF